MQLIASENDDYYSAVAKIVDETRALIEDGFEYACTHENIMFFRKEVEADSKPCGKIGGS